MKIWGLLLLFCVLLYRINNAYAFQSTDTLKVNKSMTEVIDGFGKGFIMPAIDTAAVSIESDKLSMAYQKKYIEYRINSLDRTRRAFEWQYTSSIIIFVLSVLITLFGLVFSAIHFNITAKAMLHSLPKSKNSTKVNQLNSDNDDMDISITSIEVSSSGLKMRSSVLGVIILIISLLFFFLYVKYIYPINKVKDDVLMGL